MDNNTRNHQTENKNEQLNGKPNGSDELTPEMEQEIPEALKNFDRDSVRLNTGELVYTKNDLFTIRDKAGNEVYARPGNLSSVFCKDEPGNLINTFRIVGTNGESHKSEGQEHKVRRPPPGLPATPNAAVRPPPGLPPLNSKSPHQSQQQQQSQQRYRESGYNNNNSGSKNNSEYNNNNGRGERQGRRGYNNNNNMNTPNSEEHNNEEESIILSPPRKTFPSSQSTNNQRGNRSGDGNNNKHTAPPPGFNAKNNNSNSNSNNNSANSYVPPNRRQNRGEHLDFEQQQQQFAKMRYQLKRASVETNATPNSVPNNNSNNSNNNASANNPAPQNYIDDFLFGIGKDEANNNGGYNWDTFAKFNTSITLEDEEDIVEDFTGENDSNLESKFSFASNSTNTTPIKNNNNIPNNVGSDSYSSPIRNSNSSESNATPTSSRAFGRWFSVENTTSPVSTPIKSHIPSNTDTPSTDNININNTPTTTSTTTTTIPTPVNVETPINSNNTVTALPTPPVYMDPVAESESASFITSLLSKATLQERNSGNNVSNFGQMPLPNSNSNLPQNIPMHHPPHPHLPPHMMHNPYMAHPQGLPPPPPHGFMNMGGVPTMNGPQHIPPQFMAMGRGGMPPPSPQQQQQVPMPMDQRAGLEKWFGQNIYNTGYTTNTYQAGPLPPNARMMSLEELERNQPHVSQFSK